MLNIINTQIFDNLLTLLMSNISIINNLNLTKNIKI